MQRNKRGSSYHSFLAPRLAGRRTAILLFAVVFAPIAAHAQAAVPTTSQSETQPEQRQSTGQATAPANRLPNAAKLPTYDQGQSLSPAPPPGVQAAGASDLESWDGLTISGIEYHGVPGPRLQPLQQELALQPGQPLNASKIRSSLRRLYATGVYRTISIAGVRSGRQVQLIVDGLPTLFIGRVNVTGVSDETYTSLLEGATKLSPGTPYSDAKLDRGTKLILRLLKHDGYYQGQVIPGHSLDPVNQQMNVTYVVSLGRQARVGVADLQGNSATDMTEKSFRKVSKLKSTSKVTRDTVNTAIDKLRTHFQKQQLLEAKVKLASKKYDPTTNQVDYYFNVQRGAKVNVVVKGVKMSKGSIKNLVPVFEEGTVDEDLLNEGNRRIRDLYQRKGYFDIQVSHTVTKQTDGKTLVTYNVDLGKLHDVDSVSITGNHYFTSQLIKPRLNVIPASLFDHRGTYSTALVASDVQTITAIYQGSGFSSVKVKPVVKVTNTDKHGKVTKVDHMTVTYVVSEGVQQRFGSYKLVGNIKVPDRVLEPLLNTQVGQPYSSPNLTGDRDAILTYYLSQGYDQAAVVIKQAPDPRDPNLIDVTQEITEGDQIHVNKVLVSGLHYTRAKTVDPHILVHPGDVLNQTAIINSQRRLYDLTLFNGVTAAVQNPNGDELKKNVLLQFTEAKRWDVTYGFGFQAQTGKPAPCNVAQRIREGLPAYGFCNANGSFGVGGLGSITVSRINLRGTDNSLTFKGVYGTLEKVATLTFTDPHPLGHRNLTFALSGGYTNVQDVTTYAASRLEASARITQRVGKANTFIYQYSFRRIKVDPNTIQVAADQIPLLSQPVTVGGPGVTWFRDTRRPTPLDASGGTYNSVTEFFSDGKFGSQANFNRLDYTNSSYYPFGAVRKFVFARSTRIGYERSFGNGVQQLIPLPERLYAGGAQSLRGFGINQAGPRDSVTGFPIGGAAVFANTFELRLPPPRLPYVGTSVSFVLFHDMGNVFTRGRDIWPSFLRFHQPNIAGCRDLNLVDQQAPADEPNSIGLTGRCSNNYFSHALGLGARYATPVGPIRVDFSYNLNPPIYPQIQNYDLANTQAPARVAQAPHVNFFFSIGQAF